MKSRDIDEKFVAAILPQLRHKFQSLYWQIDRLTGGGLGIVRDAVRRFVAAKSSEAAAGMAYYALFSLFPLLLVLVSAGSLVLEGEAAYRQAIALVGEAIPVSTQLIERNIQQVLDVRGAVGLVGLAGTLWSATGFFSALARNVNRAWQEAEKRSFLEQRLVALGMVGVLVLLLALSLFSTAIFGLLPKLATAARLGGAIFETSWWSAMSRVVPWLFKFVLFLALYRWVPNTKVPWQAAVTSALVTAIGWEALTDGFAWYLSSGLARYKVVYGSLGAVVALMFWIYMSCWITLFGAHVDAAITQQIDSTG